MSEVRVETLIPTLDEAENIEDAIASALPLGPVFVLDSGSTDGTQELARKAGATVVEHPWEGYAAQKNWGLDNLPFNGEWVFILDADERISPSLRDEILALLDRGTEVDGYFVNRVVLFMGRAIRHGGLYPSWNLRFFRRGKCRYEDRAVHEHMICSGPTGYLRNEMLHIRRETISEYIEKHIKYADLESDEWVKARLGRGGGAEAASMFRSLLRYRQWLRRRIWPHTPFRPMLRFLYMYFVRLGILDGRAGFHLALLMASYEYMISLLYRDKLSRVRKGLIDIDALGAKPETAAAGRDEEMHANGDSTGEDADDASDGVVADESAKASHGMRTSSSN
jgi:glycosyltransferase involved in cell wall biosynthesis